MKFPESKLAHNYLDGLKGIEIGGSAHNPFGLDTINVDRFAETDTIYKKKEVELCGEFMPVDVVAPGDCLPFENKSFDFVISSHVIEHFYDPMAALKEWARVARHYLFIIAPHHLRTFDADKEPTSIKEMIDRHLHMWKQRPPATDKHWTVFEPKNFYELCRTCGLVVAEIQNPDDKVGNGFSFVIKL